MKRLMAQKDIKRWIIGFAVLALCILVFELKFTRELLVILVEKAMHSDIDHDFWRKYIFLKTMYPAVILIAFYVDLFFARMGRIKQLIPINLILFFVLSFVNIVANGDFNGYDGGYWDNGDWVDPAVSGFGANTLYSSHYPPLMVMVFRITRYMSRTMYGGISLYAMYFLQNMVLLFSLVGLSLEISGYLKKDVKGKNWYVLSLFLTMPMLVELERLNTVIISLIFIIYFCRNYESDDKKKRYLGVLSLAVAVNLKYYPALYGALLLKRKKWKEAAVCIVAGVLLFLLPILIPKNATMFQNQYYLEPYQKSVISRYKDFIETSSETSALNNSGITIEKNGVIAVAAGEETRQSEVFGGIRNIFSFVSRNMTDADASLWSVMLTICRLLHIPEKSILPVEIVAILIWAAASVVAFIKTRRRDIEYALIALFILMAIPNTFWYVGILLLPALIEFINKDKYIKYDICMCVTWIFTMLFYVDFEGMPIPRMVNKWVPVVLWVVMICGALLECIGKKRNLKINDALIERKLGA